MRYSIKNQLRRFRLALASLLLLFSYNHLSAQQTLTTIGGWNAYVHLPDDYYTTTQRYPVIVFIGGIGEVGSNPNDILVYGPAHFINQGHNMQFMVDGVLEKPIVISMQPPAAWPAPAFLNRQIDSIYARWRIDTTRLALTGLSMGGSSWDNYVTLMSGYWKRPACIVAMSAPPPANPVSNFEYFARAGAKWWGFEGTQDYRQMDIIRDVMNDAVPGSARYTQYVGGHCCWNTWYDPNWTENGESIYTWMLKQRRPTPTPVIYPIGYAGPDQTISLPTNSVTLNGSGSDADGSITNYHWVKIAGPTQFSLGNSNSAQATVSNLAQGVYRFRLQVVDNAWNSDFDTVQITVTAAPPPPGNQPPLADAGGDQQIILPLNTVTLNGSASDADGIINSYTWTKIAGPTAFNILTPSTAQTTVTGLVQGTYRFRLSATDDGGASDADTVVVTVNAAPPPPNQLPVTNAGTDQTITLPINAVDLNGSASDADGTIASYAWTKISGPTNFNIVSPSAPQTTINNLVQGVYQFRLLATDNAGGSDADTVTVTVNAAPPPPNQPPVSNAGADQNITLPANSVTLNGAGTDTDGSITTYAWTKISGPASFTIISATSAQTNVTSLVQGTYQFVLTVTDNDGASDTDTVSVTVNAAPPPPANILPVANAGNDQTITLPTNTVSLTGSATDADGTIASYAWTKISGPAAFSIVSPANAQTTLNGLVQGVYQFVLTATDNNGGTDADTVSITVNAAPPPPANILPVSNAGNDQVITLPTNTVTLNGSGTDADGTIATYAWTKIAGPATFTIVSAASAQTNVNGLIQGTYQFVLIVTDNSGGSDADTISVTVNAAPPPANIAPIANAGNDITITLPVNSVNLSGSGTDADGTITSYGWNLISGPATYTIASPSSAQTNVNNLVQGVYQFALTVTDNNGATDRDTVIVTVNAAPPPANIAPVANAGNDQSITLPLNSIVLSGGGTDTDGTIASYSWTRIAGPASSTISSPSSVQTTVSNLVQGAYQFRLVVTDNLGATDADTMNVTVYAAPVPNQLPTANAGADMNITLPNNSVTLNGSGTDPDGSITNYLWTKITGPTQFTIMSATSGQTVVNNLTSGVYQFELRVTDNIGAIDRDTVMITVNAPLPGNIAPVAEAGSNTSIMLPVNSNILNGSATDVDGNITGYVWTKIAGPQEFHIVNSTSAQTTVQNMVRGTYQFELTVTDNAGAIGKDTVTITVVDPVVSTATVYPNPADGIINIRIDANTNINQSSLILYDVTGKPVYTEQFMRNSPSIVKQVDISALPRGVYVLEVGVDINKRIAIKVIKK